jgi:hypothetical protein
LAAPPEIGASRYSSPRSASRASSATDQFGSTVEHITNSAARLHRRGGAAFAEQHGFGLRALTTTLTTTSHERQFGRVGAGHAAFRGEGLRRLRPDVAHEHAVAGAPQRPAMPRPMAPRPITPMLVSAFMKPVLRVAKAGS